ncbi:terminase large subunit domain-containing protein [Ensifer sp. ENS03]|uniref:terminase large subunit domain-containing protein n=1 Tax=Ensifer sp. ENS03 TaxID=2769283 RepID=UPI001FED5CE5|nr:terminase family protein [Ensifer sp. ENS03]
MNNSSSGSASSTRPSGLSSLLRERVELAMEIGRRQNTNRLRYYQPYTKQTAFHEAGATFRERLFMAGNQLGKTLAGAAEAAMHLTGDYPSWWAGRRFDRPITMIGGSESHELTRDGVQRLLVGPPMSEEDWGTGYLPKAAISGWTRRSSASGALDSVTVRHTSGGTSTLLLKAYEQGRAKWQANTVDYVWFDEEPPEDVYFEGITRTNATGGSVAVTFTPLKGMSSVVSRYLLEPSDDRTVVTMTIDDAEHYSPEERAKIVASYPAHEKEARTKGVPTLGSGRIFPVTEEQIRVEPFEIPRHWVQIGGLDFGWDHPFAAALCAWDRDADARSRVGCIQVLFCKAVRKPGRGRPGGAPACGRPLPSGRNSRRGPSRNRRHNAAGRGESELLGRAAHASMAGAISDACERGTLRGQSAQACEPGLWRAAWQCRRRRRVGLSRARTGANYRSRELWQVWSGGDAGSCL